MRPDRRIGTQIAGYTIEALLGRGGMGAVYLAQQTRPRRKVALKLLLSDLSDDDAFRERFNRESDLAASVDHPNILPVYEAGEADGLLYLAMRYVHGSDLKSLLRRSGPLDLSRAVSILGQVASGLDAAHRHGLVHRDVKPGNILVASGTGPEPVDHVYLSDFGLTKRTDSVTGLTLSGQFVGTPDYVAPEQIEGRHLDHRVDVYALGCVLFECLVGRAPYRRDVEWAVLSAHLREPVPSVSALRPDVPEDLDQVVRTALAKDPDDRYSSCTALITAGAAVAARVRRGRPAEIVPARDSQEASAGADTSMSPSRYLSTVESRLVEVCSDAVSALPPSALRDVAGSVRQRILDPLHVIATAAVGAETEAALDAVVRALREDDPRPINVSFVRSDPIDLSAADARVPDEIAHAEAFVAAVTPEQVDSGDAAALLGYLRRRGRASPVNAIAVLVRLTSADGPKEATGTHGDLAELAQRLAENREGRGSVVSVIPIVVAVSARPDSPVDASAVDELRRLSREVFAARAGMLKADWAVAELERAIPPDAELSHFPGAVDLRDKLESLKLESHELHELRVLRQDRAGLLPLPQEFREDLRRVLSESTPWERLGVPADSGPQVLKDAAEHGAERWRTLLSGGRARYAARNAAEVVVAAYDRLWHATDGAKSRR